MNKTKLLLIALIFILFVSSAQAAQVKLNGTQYYEKLDGSMTATPSIITESPLGYRINFLGMYYFTVWDGLYAYDTLNYPNGTFVSPWIFPHIEYWRTTGQKRWVEVIPINNTFEQSNNQIIRRMVMGDGSLFNITYSAYDKIKYTWDFTAGQNQNYSIVLRMDSAASEDINPVSKRYTPGWFGNRTFYSYGDIQEPYASNISSWYSSGDRKFFQRIILGQQGIGNSTEIDPSVQFNGSTSPAWANSTLSNMRIIQSTDNIELEYSPSDFISHITFDENTGTLAVDENTSTKGNATLGANAVWNASVAYRRSSVMGNATATSTLTISDQDIFDLNNQSFSIIMSIYPTVDLNSITADTLLIGKKEAGYNNNGWLFYVEQYGGQLIALDMANGVAREALTSNSITWNANTSYWVGVTFNYTSKVATFYLNKNNIGTASYTLLGATAAPNTQPVRLLNGITSINGINSGVDELYIFNRVLNQSEINSTMSNGRLGSGYVIFNATFESGRQGSISNSTILDLDANNLYFINSSTDNSTYTSDCSSSCANITNYSITSKAQTQWLRINISGNGSSTPEINEVTIYDEAVAEGGEQGAIPPDPINLSQTNSSTGFWINYTWQAGSGNITNSYNVSVNGTWTNGSANNFSNSTVNPHGWRNITVWAFNSSGNGNLSTGSVTLNTQIPNNAPVQSSIGNKNVNEGSWLNFTISSSDADGDALTYDSNKTKGTLTTNSYSWTPTYSDSGTYIWYFNTTDNYSAVATETITVTVNNVNQIPPTPLINSTKTGNFFVNTSWTAGSGNVTDGYNSTNGTTWINSTSTFRNTTLSSHAWQNLTIYAWNITDNVLSSTALTNNTQIPNNAISISNVSTSYSIAEGQTLNIDADYTDADSDTGTFSDNATQWNVNTGTGVVSWLTVDGNQGTYNWNISVVDGYGSTSTVNFTVIVSDSTPTAISNLQNTTFNFGINWTWDSGNNADDYDVQINSTDIGYDNTTRYYNGTYSAHATRIISIRSHNHTLDSYSAWVNQTTTIPNNIPVLSSIGNKNVNENQLLSFSLTGSDDDSDAITCGTNATKGTLTDCDYSWTPNYTESGNYVFIYYYNDSYGGSDSEIITITVNNIPLNISSFLPASDPSSTQGTSQAFNITINRAANVTWFINGTQVQYNSSVTIANYSNNTAGILASYNVTANINESASPDTDSHRWNWTVTSAITNNPPNITAWWNSINGWNQTAMSINAGNSATFNVTTNQTPTAVSWKVGGSEEQNTSSTEFTRAFNTIGSYNVTAQAFNANGSSNIIYTVVTVAESGGGGTDYDYAYGWVKYPNGTGVNLASITTSVCTQTTNATGYYSCGYVFIHNDNYNFNITKSGHNWSNQTISFAAGDYQIVNATLDVIVLYAPNITSWSNSNTSNNSLTFTVQRNTNVTFNITANQSVTTTWTGTASPTKINGTNENISYAFKNFTTAGTFTVIASCSNANGTCTNPPTWTITVTAIGGHTLSGYVINTLELPLQNARIDLNNSNHAFTNSTGYYNFTNITENDYVILARAIGYRNGTNSTTIISNASVNFTLKEKTTGAVQAPGFEGTIVLFILSVFIYLRKREIW